MMKCGQFAIKFLVLLFISIFSVNALAGLSAPATFTVFKDFSDDSTAPVQVSLRCTAAFVRGGGTSTAAEGSPAVFDLANVSPGNVCIAKETVPAGYTANVKDCESVPTEPGTSERCTIINTLIPTTATFTVFKNFTDKNPAHVSINLKCTSATLDSGSKQASNGSPAIFNLSDIGAGNECTATEPNVPPGYVADESRCDAKRAVVGGSNFCTITNTPVPVETTFTVKKDFSDDNPVPVDVTLVCSGASIDSATRQASEGSPAVFNLSAVTEGNQCTATETVPAGYTAEEGDCNAQVADPGSSNMCQIINTKIPDPEPAQFTVHKDFSDDNTVPVDVTLVCSGATIDLPTKPASETSPAVFNLSAVADGNVCSATETVPEGYTPDESNCTGLAAGPGSSIVCGITNTLDIPPSGVEFVMDTYSADEDAGVATIAVRRTGGTVGPLMAYVITDDDNPNNTAVAGEDYTSTRAAVSWGDGESGERSAQIPIADNLDDGATSESVALELESESGAVVDMATLEIKGDFAEEVGGALTDPSLPPNQQAIAAVIAESCPQGGGGVNQTDFQALCGEIVGDAFNNARPNAAALSAATPDDAAAVRSSGMQTSNVQATAVDGRLGTIRGGGGAGFSASGFSIGFGDATMSGGLIKSFLNAFDQNNPGFMQTNASQNADADLLDEFGRWGAWISGRLIFGEKDQTTNQIEYDFDTAGLTFGLDYRFTEEFVAGVAVGYSNTDVDLGIDGGELDTEGYSVSLYGTYFKSDRFYLGGSIGIGSNDYDQTRNVRYQLGGDLSNPAINVDQTLGARYDGNQFEIALNGGWDFNRNGWTFGPTFHVNYVEVDVDAYDESLIQSGQANATTGWGVHIDDQNYESLQLSIGFEFSKAISRSWGVFIPQGYVDVVTEVLDDGNVVTGQFLGDGSNVQFTLLTDDFEETFAKAGLGFGLVFKNNKSAFLMLDGDIGRDLLQTYYVNAGFRWQF